MRTWLSEPLSPQVERSLARLRGARDVAGLAIMPDVHLAHDVCIGTVFATRGLLYPAAIGGDVGCGVAALRLSGQLDALDEQRSEQLLAGLRRMIPILQHGSATRPAALPADLDDLPCSRAAMRLRKREARRQLGSLGRGNHFVELQADDAGQAWLMIHSGSRSLGPALQAFHQRHEQGRSAGLGYLEADSAAGRAWLADQAWARAWARCNRQRLAAAACAVLHQVLGLEPQPDSWIDCDHNHVRWERHQGQEIFVHRKGAIRADLDEQGLIPGSMGSASFHVRGRGCSQAFASASHGAGRRFSRSQARERIARTVLVRQMRGVRFDQRRARSLVEEAPGAYRDIRRVMAAQRQLVKITRRLTPRLVFKG